MFATGPAGPAQITDHVHVALTDDAGDITGLDTAVPHRAGASLRRRGEVELLQLLAVRTQRDQRGPGRIGDPLVGVGDQLDPVAHRHPQILPDMDGLPAGVESVEFGHESVTPPLCQGNWSNRWR